MYLLLVILLLIALFGSIFFWWRKRRIFCRIQCMDPCQKCCKVNEIVKPFG